MAPKQVLFTNGSSFIQDGVRYAGAVVMDLDTSLSNLLVGLLAQKAELKALTQVLKLAKGAIANIYTDSRWDY